jgi:hypothetical protein
VGWQGFCKARFFSGRSRFANRDSWVRGLSSPFTVATQRHSAEAAPGPALTAVSPLRFISKRLWRRGHADRRSAHPAPRVFNFHGGHSAEAAPGTALTAVSPLHFISKRLWRRGHADRRSAHPAPRVFNFHGGHSAEAAPGRALTAVSPLHFISKRLCHGDMRTGGPRTQKA